MGLPKLETTHQAVLGLVGTYSGPADVYELCWEVDYGEDRDLYKELGPRPRNGELYRILGDLADRGLVVLTAEGVTLPQTQTGLEPE